MEQKRPADIFQPGPGGKGLEASEKGQLQKENEKRPDLPDLV